MMKVRASLAKNPQEVSAMFDDVAEKYDRVNSLFTFGCDKWWRKKMVSSLQLTPQMRVLDVATGSAVSARAIADNSVQVVGIDFSLGMLEIACTSLATHPKAKDSSISLLGADAMFLPFIDESFDAVSIAFGLRNVQTPHQAVQEFLRVLKPGGRLVILETSVPKNRFLRYVIETIGYRFTKIIAKLASSHAQAYSYLIDSVLAWPGARELQEILLESGYAHVHIRRLLGGVVAIHCADKQ